jgi:hypothetical protein
MNSLTTALSSFLGRLPRDPSPILQSGDEVTAAPLAEDTKAICADRAKAGER